MLELTWLRTGIRTFESEIGQKNKNIEAQQNFTGSYKKRVYKSGHLRDFCTKKGLISKHFCITHNTPNLTR